MALSPKDPSSFSRPENCMVTSLQLDLDVDFSKHVLKGTVKIDLERKNESTQSVILDTRGLVIHSVCDAQGEGLHYVHGEPVGSFGRPLEITLRQDANNKTSVTVEYETSPNSSALQWLEPEQTAGKKQPYLFSQCQAIHARSMVPCQDSPGVKMPYCAQVTAPSELVVLMSAVRQGTSCDIADPRKTVHKFEQKVPIPSYLIAIVAGALESRDIGPRSKVWSEKEMVDAAAYEFAETEQFLATAEELLGPYVWGVYDLLVLPPSFPYGGMENPCLTFVTPTLLAGDRSLADVVAHEISHSWTGNLVTNASPEHFWLNEGHTVFVERKIVGRIHGEKFRHFSALEGLKNLKYTVSGAPWLNEGHTKFVERKIVSKLRGGERMRHFLSHEGWRILHSTVHDVLGAEHPYTHLVPKLEGVDPDDAFSPVPYEKGCNLLMYLEQKLGGPAVFEPFLKAYIERFKYKSITTDDWKAFLYEFFSDKKADLDEVDWEAWFTKPGMPPIKPDYDTSLVDACTFLAKRWSDAGEDDLGQFTSDDLKDMTSPQVREFLAQLLEEAPLSAKKIARMEKLYGFNAVKNAEIRFRWLRLGLRARLEETIPRALEFATEQGRMKFTRPIFRDLFHWQQARPQSVEHFERKKSTMHTLTATMVGKDLEKAVAAK